ncbi:unnamed protein product [Albugo candida]|uniref:Uncharacterized protein n=1 Tax=Albugo candida TaxID=65357 RepID=A0A024GM37_9STRA|nr:unnamed protein product [Albugo candida]|eukprot:CCI47910.1 unnamed protein product [Albugo candida]
MIENGIFSSWAVFNRVRVFGTNINQTKFPPRQTRVVVISWSSCIVEQSLKLFKFFSINAITASYKSLTQRSELLNIVLHFHYSRVNIHMSKLLPHHICKEHHLHSLLSCTHPFVNFTLATCHFIHSFAILTDTSI